MDEAKAPEEARSLVRAAFGAVVGHHLALIAYFAPNEDPMVMVECALHAYQVDRALIAIRHWHQLWGWDPLLVAGQPAGVAEDLKSRGAALDRPRWRSALWPRSRVPNPPPSFEIDSPFRC